MGTKNINSTVLQFNSELLVSIEQVPEYWSVPVRPQLLDINKLSRDKSSVEQKGRSTSRKSKQKESHISYTDVLKDIALYLIIRLVNGFLDPLINIKHVRLNFCTTRQNSGLTFKYSP